MRHWILVTLALLLPGAARAEDDIVAVLARSQQLRLASFDPVEASGARARAVRTRFETRTRALGVVQPVQWRLIRGDTVAEAVQGRIVLANEALADLGEGERLFILAHELGHIELRHWEQTERLYQKWVPGAVTPEQTEPVAALLGRDASGLAHRHEYEADAFALRALHRLGRPWEDALAALIRRGTSGDTATHPGTRKRLASLRAAEAQWLGAGQAMTRNELIDSVNRPD